MAKTEQISTAVTPELKADFDSFCKKFDLTQKDAIATLLERYGDDALKELAPGQADAISAFSRHLEALKDAYSTSVRMGVEAKEAARDELKLELDRKDKTIDTYQQQADDLLAKADQATVLATQMEKQVKALTIQLEEQKKINATLTAELAAANAKAADYDRLEKEYNDLKAEYDALKVANLEDQLQAIKDMMAEATKPKKKDKTVQPKAADTTISFLE